ncbi:hypothetical protein PROVRUST_06412 [Providencia rustigianii DSM 4541]|uniref:Uncharacterized protein n=1 Tax=Providencia rustigianii DSM 4541 TaxID=500637 RepID=D1P2I7_9GAMM|nr:hypothetical protein PROVRUST_06412 [Providencia rustigianii DSM 4541]
MFFGKRCHYTCLMTTSNSYLEESERSIKKKAYPQSSLPLFSQ